MCGIAGIVRVRRDAKPPERDALLRMTHALRHRGPDEFGLYRDAHAGLAHARLSIVDLASGQQPLSNEDGSLWVSFNGEIFNYVELTRELERVGHRFRTRSDTEVLVHAYEEWGDGAFPRMNGQWAFALWDAREQKLVLGRDRVGVRPLFVCENGGRVYFASEVKAIFAADAGIPRALDPVGLDQTFTFWSVVPPQTMFRGVEELRPGSTRTYHRGGVKERTYFTPSYPDAETHRGLFGGSFDEAVRAVRSSLERATTLRMLRADVPVGSYLSGGLDSSFIAALARRAISGTFRTFSLRFDDAEYDEGAFQRLMVQHLGSEHHEIVVGRRDIARAFPDVVLFAERPLLRTAAAPLFLLSRLVRDGGVKVVLTGEGADEMFAGYDLFREAKVRRFWARHPESVCRPRLLERLYPYLARSPVSKRAMARDFFGRSLHLAAEPGFGHHPRWETTGALKRLFSRELKGSLVGRDAEGELLSSLPEDFGRWSPLAQDQYLEVRTLLTGYLLSSQGDRMLMAHGVEGRFPFLDKDVIALADSLPSEHKLFGLAEKHVVKRAAAGLVPAEILKRRKQPYRAPDAVSFVEKEAPDFVGELLSERAIRDAGVFEPDVVLSLHRKCRARAPAGQFSNTDNMALVGVLSTQILYERMVRRPPATDDRLPLATDVDRSLDVRGSLEDR